MPFCPKCQMEYREGFEVCSDCKLPLAEELPEPPEEGPLVYSDPVFLCNAGFGLESDLLVGALKNEGIPPLVKHRGAGGYLTVVMGASYQGVDIFVPSCMLEQAQEILDAFPGMANSDDGDVPADVHEDDEGDELSTELYRVCREKRIKGWVSLALYIGVPSLLIVLIYSGVPAMLWRLIANFLQ